MATNKNSKDDFDLINITAEKFEQKIIELEIFRGRKQLAVISFMHVLSWEDIVKQLVGFFNNSKCSGATGNFPGGAPTRAEWPRRGG